MNIYNSRSNSYSDDSDFSGFEPEDITSRGQLPDNLDDVFSVSSVSSSSSDSDSEINDSDNSRSNSDSDDSDFSGFEPEDITSRGQLPDNLDDVFSVSSVSSSSSDSDSEINAKTWLSEIQ